MRNSHFFQNCGTCCCCCCIEKYQNFERNEDRATVFLKWTDFRPWLIRPCRQACIRPSQHVIKVRYENCRLEFMSIHVHINKAFVKIPQLFQDIDSAILIFSECQFHPIYWIKLCFWNNYLFIKILLSCISTRWNF